MDQTIIDAAVKELEWGQTSSIPFDGEYYQGLVSNYRDFVEHLFGDAAARIYTTLRPLFENPAADHGELLGEHLRLNRKPEGSKGVVVEILSTTNSFGMPRFSLTVSSEPFRQGKVARVIVRDNRGDEHPEYIARLNVFDEKTPLRGVATCMASGFPAFIEFLNAYVGAVPHLREAFVGMSDGGMINDEFVALRDADGGILGDHTLAAFDAYLTRAATHVCDWAASVVVETHASQTERGYVWGEKYLIHNDLDDSSCAVPTGKPGRVAVMHDNSSLMSDYRRFLAWVDGGEDGKPKTLRVRMLLADEILANAVADLRVDELAATLEYDIESRSLVKSANYYKSNLMEMFPFYLNVDHHLFALAEMDEDGFNCHVGTDFTHLERDIEEEFEEEDDAASQPSPARRLP